MLFWNQCKDTHFYYTTRKQHKCLSQ